MVLIHPTVLKKCSLMSGGLVRIRSGSSKVVAYALCKSSKNNRFCITKVTHICTMLTINNKPMVQIIKLLFWDSWSLLN